MSFLFMPKSSWTPPQDRPGYVNPFIQTVEQVRHSERQRYEGMAHLIKRHSGDKRSIEDIAASLSRAQLRKDTGI